MTFGALSRSKASPVQKGALPPALSHRHWSGHATLPGLDLGIHTSSGTREFFSSFLRIANGITMTSDNRWWTPINCLQGESVGRLVDIFLFLCDVNYFNGYRRRGELDPQIEDNGDPL